MRATAVQTTTELFDVVLDGATLIVTPTAPLRELDFQGIGFAADEVLTLFSKTPAKNVVLDLRSMDYCGSTALGFFVQLGQKVKRRNGRMAFCNVSEHEREALEWTSLDRLAPVYPSLQEALAGLGG